MKKEEKAMLKDIAGMIGKLIDMSGKEENQQQAAEESVYNEEDAIDCDDVDFVKKMLENDIYLIKFIALCSDGSISGGQINKPTLDAMCNAFLEKYA